MDVGDLLSLVLGGLVVGALARLAVPGPDPMPVWLTAAVGLAGVFLGGGVGFVIAAELGAFLGAILCATLILIVYRRFVQRRGITGPEAQEYPTRGLGLRRRRPDVDELVQKLADLRDAGVLTPAEYEAKRSQLVARPRA